MSEDFDYKLWLLDQEEQDAAIFSFDGNHE